MSSELQEGWRKVELADIAKLSMGETLLSKNLTGDGIPVFSANTDDGPWGFTSNNRRQLQRGDIVIGARGSIGFPRRPDFDAFTCTQTTIAVEPNREVVDTEYLHHALVATDILGIASQQAVPMLTIGSLSPLEIALPPLDEQGRIAEVLRSVDQTIAAAEAVIAQLRETRNHRLETLMALPGAHRRIDEVCRLSGGNGFPIKCQGKKAGQYPFAKVSDMNRRGNETQMRHAENYIDDSDVKALKAKTFPIGTTFFPKVGATLLTNKRRIAAVEMLVDNNVMAAVATEIDPWFLYYAFCTIDMADYVQPGAVPSVNQRTVGQIMIPVPDEAVQEEFVKNMRDLDTAIEMQLGGLAQLIATKKALMSDILSGRVRVPA